MTYQPELVEIPTPNFTEVQTTYQSANDNVVVRRLRDIKAYLVYTTGKNWYIFYLNCRGSCK